MTRIREEEDWTMQAVLCIVHCNKVSKPVKGKYLLLCMNSIMYLLLTWYNLIIFLKVLSHLILKIKSFMKDFKISWNFEISHEFLITIFHYLCYHYFISNFPPSAAELFRLPPHRSRTHYQTQSFRHQHCGRSSTNWKLSLLWSL